MSQLFCKVLIVFLSSLREIVIYATVICMFDKIVDCDSSLNITALNYWIYLSEEK